MLWMILDAKLATLNSMHFVGIVVTSSIPTIGHHESSIHRTSDTTTIIIVRAVGRSKVDGG